MTTIAQQIDTLREAFGQVERVDPAGPTYRALCATLDRASDEALRQIYAARIKLVSALALNRMIKRGLLD